MSVEIKTCPVCSGKSFRLKLVCKDYSASLEDFKIVSCETCGFVFTNPRPNNSDIDRYYEAENYISHSNNKKGFFIHFKFEGVKDTLDKIKDKIKVDASIIRNLTVKYNKLDKDTEYFKKNN